MNIEIMARLAHELNRAYCATLGDLSQLPWEQAPEWQKESARQGVRFHLDRYQFQGFIEPQASHKSWMDLKVREGWVYGPEKDPEKKQHPCLVPFDNLPPDQQMKDYLFTSVVGAFILRSEEQGTAEQDVRAALQQGE